LEQPEPHLKQPRMCEAQALNHQVQMWVFPLC